MIFQILFYFNLHSMVSKSTGFKNLSLNNKNSKETNVFHLVEIPIHNFVIIKKP